MSELPDYPWQQLSLDFFSLPSGEELLVLIDDFSRFPEVEVPNDIKQIRNPEIGSNLINVRNSRGYSHR